MNHRANDIRRRALWSAAQFPLFVLAVLTAFACSTSQGYAASVAYRFGGTLDGAFGSLAAGTTFSGTLRYDADAAPVGSWPPEPPHITQDYPYEEFTLAIDGQTISAVPGASHTSSISFSTAGCRWRSRHRLYQLPA